MVEERYLLPSLVSDTFCRETAPPEAGGDCRHHAIVLAAYRTLAEQGFEGLRTREVAARVGLNHATLHYYFPTKKALVQAVVDYIGGVFNAVHAVFVEKAKDSSPEEALRFYIGIILRQMEETPELFVAINELRMRAIRDESVQKILHRCDGKWRTSLVETITAGQESRHFRTDLDPMHTANMLISFLMGASIHYELDRSGRERAAATLLACLTVPPDMARDGGSIT